jgi:hypothetical protein
MKMPKGITNHPAVEECNDAAAMGFDESYKYNVILKDGWVWSTGRNEGGQSCNVCSVEEFRDLKPVKVAK